MRDNLQSLCAQVEQLCINVEEMLASPATIDCAAMQAKLALVRQTIAAIQVENKVSDLTYNVELGIWEPSDQLQF